jgi:hypothetical protein
MPPSLAMAPIVLSNNRCRRRLYSLATKRRIVQLANQANQVTPDKSSVFLIAKQHNVLPCQIERWRVQFEIIDATIVDATIIDATIIDETITNNDESEESPEVNFVNQSWYSSNVDSSNLNRSEKKSTFVIQQKIRLVVQAVVVNLCCLRI